VKQRVSGVLASSCGLALAVAVSAQPSRTPPIESPVVHPDRTVTFAIKAPNARKVELSAQFMKDARPLKLLWLGVGREDFLYKPAIAFEELLTQGRIEHESLVTGGAHTWMNARHYLAETLERFFK
jgi:hypothetical protein